jgi:hypothetical protein
MALSLITDEALIGQLELREAALSEEDCRWSGSKEIMFGR